MRIDLHLHSSASDGSLAPSAIPGAARAGNLEIIALTDHDTAAGVAAAQAASGASSGAGPIVIPGIEISSSKNGAELHFLGYFIDYTDPVLAQFAEAAAERRRERMEGMVQRLQDLGVNVEYDDVIKAAGPDTVTLGRPHLARALVDGGHVRTITEAFDRYLADGGAAFLPTNLVTPCEAIAIIQELGGIAVWAHPPWEVLEVELRNFVDCGLQGLECYRPRNTTIGTGRLLDAAGAYDLFTTGGSDWHGDWHGPLGSFSVRRDQVEGFLREGGL